MKNDVLKNKFLLWFENTVLGYKNG